VVREREREREKASMGGWFGKGIERPRHAPLPEAAARRIIDTTCAAVIRQQATYQRV
jgi:hypothetical protein